MKAVEHCFHTVYRYYAARGASNSKRQLLTIQMKASEQHVLVVLLIMSIVVNLTFKSVDETLVCDHSNKSY